jgi:hypothetical protein
VEQALDLETCAFEDSAKRAVSEEAEMVACNVEVALKAREGNRQVLQ